MTEGEIDSLIDALEAHQRAGDALLARLRAASALQPGTTVALERQNRNVRHVDATRAFAEKGFEFNDDKIQRICRHHPEWALKLGHWCVTEPYFSDFVDLVKRGEAKFKLSDV